MIRASLTAIKILGVLLILPGGQILAQATPDWLLDPSSYEARVIENKQKNELSMTNGLINRTFRTAPNAATVGFDNLVSGQALLRGQPLREPGLLRRGLPERESLQRTQPGLQFDSLRRFGRDR